MFYKTKHTGNIHVHPARRRCSELDTLHDMPTDPRVLVPVDVNARELLVFEPPRFGALTGWAVVWHNRELFDGEGRLIRIRFGPSRGETPEEDADRRALVIHELYVTGRSALSGRRLRTLPLSRYEAAVNTPAARAALDPLLKLGSLVALPWQDRRALSDDDDRDWWFVPPRFRKPRVTEPPALQIPIPKGYGRPDSFYETVAQVYGYLTTVSNRPANELAEANDVPVTTVHGWVKEARRRGLLKPRDSRGGAR